MGVRQTLARLFGFGGGAGDGPHVPEDDGEKPVRQAPPVPDRPVAVDVYSEEEPGVSAPLAPAPRNRQEMVEELRKNYAEVLGIVRKVDDHLDQQSHRSERLLELAERSARHMEVLPDLAEQNRRVADALADLVELTRDMRTRHDATSEKLTRTAHQQLESAQRQTAAMLSMQSALHRSGEAEAEMARTMSGFNETLGDMAGSTRDLGSTISAMRETDAEREAELSRLVSTSQKWLVAAVVFCGLAAVAVLALVINRVV